MSQLPKPLSNYVSRFNEQYGHLKLADINNEQLIELMTSQKAAVNNLFMAGAHVAHDCDIGNNCVLANNVMIAGHVQIGDWAILGGLSAVHQWTRIGSHSFLGGFSALTKDLIPYGLAVGNRATLEGLNLTGLRRRNFNNEEIKKVKRAYSVLFENDENEFNDRIEKLKSENIKSSVVEELISFITQKGSRSYCLPKVS